MRRGEAGGAAIHILGCALMLLLLVAGLGLAESAQAALFKAQGLRALAAAAESAARSSPDTAADTFQRVLAANLGGLPGKGAITLLPKGGRDPISGEASDRPMLVARLVLTYRPTYIGRWLRPVPVQLSYTALLPEQRKTAP